MTKKYISLEHAIRNAVRDQQYTKKPLNEDFEFEMARNELRTAIDAAKRLMAHMDGEGELEAWVQSKITKGADYLDTVADYMDSRDTKKLKEHTEELMEAISLVGVEFKGNQFQGGTPEIGPGHTKAAMRTSTNRRSSKQDKSLTMHGKVVEEVLSEDANEDYYNKMHALAKKHGSPDPHVTASIAALESNWGKSRMAREGRNHFGQTVRKGQPGMIGADGQSHKVYDTDDDAVKHHVERWGKHYTDNGPKSIESIRRAGYNSVNPAWGTTVGAIHAKRQGREMPEMPDTDTASRAPEQPKIKQASVKPDLPDLVTKGSDSDSDSPKLYMGGKVVPFSPSRGTVSPTMAYADTGAPKAPKEPEEPKEPKTVSSAASDGNQSAGEYWNQEAARNKAAGGAPLPNEFNIFGDKPKKSLKETILEVRRDSLIKEEDKKKDDDEEDDSFWGKAKKAVSGYVSGLVQAGKDVVAGAPEAVSSVKGAEAAARGAKHGFTGRDEPVDPKEIADMAAAGHEASRRLGGPHGPASRKNKEAEVKKSVDSFTPEYNKEKSETEALKTAKPEAYKAGKAVGEYGMDVVAGAGLAKSAIKYGAKKLIGKTSAKPTAVEKPKLVEPETTTKPVETKTKVETPEVKAPSPPKLNVPDQVTAKPTSKNIISFRKFTRKTEAPVAVNDTSLPGMKATEVPDAFKVKKAPDAANDVIPKVEAPKTPKAPEEAPMPQKGGKKEPANNNLEPEELGTGTTGPAPKPKIKEPEKIKEPYNTGAEVTKENPKPKAPKSNDNLANDNTPGKKDSVPQGTPAPKEKGKYRPGVKVTKSNPNTLPNNDNATVAPKVASPAPSVAPAPAKAPAPKIAPRLAPAPEAVPEPAPKIAPRPRPEAVPRPRPEAVPRPRPEPIKKVAEKPPGPKRPIIPPFFGGGGSPEAQYNWNKNHANPWLMHRAQKRIQNEETGPDNTRRKDSSKELVGRPNSAGVKDPKSVLGRNASIVSKIIEEKKLAGLVKTVVKKKKEEKEGGPNPLEDFEPKLNHKYDNES